MTEQGRTPHATPPLAVVGLACRFPDADDPAALLDVVLTARRTFRRLPPGRIDLAEYYQPDLAISDATYSTRAAVLEGWKFESTAFGIDQHAYIAADLAHWLALETAARALSAAGLPSGNGLNRDRTGVIIGNTLAGDTSRANALRVRWPYVRRVLADALGSAEIPASQAEPVLLQAESSYLGPFPPVGATSLAGSMPGTIAATISSHFGFRGGSHAVDSACSSALQAVASACSALVTGDLDAVIAGGVDLSLDPLELIGLAKAGLLATGDVRVYDQHPTGYLPGEGCGIAVLMRAADARAASLPVFAEILGWGVSGGAQPGEAQSQADSQLLAMQRAYERSGIDPADIHFIEGNGASNPLADEAELSALNSIRAGAKNPVALGSVKANIGHAKAAAGAAGLIKTVLALSSGVVPPTTGTQSPHELVTHGDGNLILPSAARDWDAGTRLAAVSATGIGGSNVHVVLRHEPATRQKQERKLRSGPLLAKSPGKAGTGGGQSQLAAAPAAMPFLLHAADRFELARQLSRIAAIADWLSDAEMQDLACMLGRDAENQGLIKVAIVAARQEQLAMLAREAVTMLPYLADGRLTVRPGIFASNDARGRVTLLLSADLPRALRQQSGPAPISPAVTRCLAALRWLDSLDVHAAAAVGHGIGALAGLAWAGALGESEVIEIAHLRAQYLRRSADRKAPAASTSPDAKSDLMASSAAGVTDLSAAIAQRFRFGPPRRRLISAETGTEIETVADAIEMICNGFAGSDRLTDAITAGAANATLLLETGPGHALVTTAAEVTAVPAISLKSGLTDPASAARAAAALFAAGAVGDAKPLFAGRAARPVDIWREQVFITSPCAQPQVADSGGADGAVASVTPIAGSVPTPCRFAGDESGITDTGSQETDRECAAPVPAEATASGEGISSLRDEFERRLPAHPLIEAAAAQPDAVAEADAAAEPDAAAQADPVAEADAAAQADPVAEADAAAQADPVAEADAAAGPDAAAQADTVAEADAAAEPDAAARADTVAEADAAAQADPVAEADAAPQPADVDPGISTLVREVTALLAARPAPGADARSVASSDEPATREDGDEIAVPSSQQTAPAAALGSWARCFAEGLRPVRRPLAQTAPKPWRMFAAARSPVLTELAGSFQADPCAGRTLAVVEDPSDQQSSAAAIEAAKDAITTGEIVVLTTGSGFTGFFASLYAEHPSIGITIVRVPDGGSATGLIRSGSILRCMSAERGKFRELVLSPDGAVSEPVLSELALTGGDVALGTDDVIMVTRATSGAGLVLAQVLACCGAGVAVIGRPGDHDDAQLVAGFEELRSAGARVSYQIVDIDNPASVAAAVERVEDRLGPVTAIAHAAGLDEPVLVNEIAEPAAAAQVGGEAGILGLLASSVRSGQLRLIISVGTVASRYGLAGAALHALSSAVLASRATELAAARAGCQSLHLDLPAWSSTGLGDRPELADELAAADVDALDIAQASRLLFKIMSTPGLPCSIAVHGRVGSLPAVPEPVITRAHLAAAGLADGGAFLREVNVHYPGTELVCSAKLSLATDPYLTDYRIDGMPVLPPVLALEALAQAASVLAGRPLRRLTNVALESPILIPTSTQAALRVSALRDGDTIFAALRCADSSFLVDHARAEFSCSAEPAAMPRAATADGSPVLELGAGQSGLVDGAELYGPVCFQSGRFRRIALATEVTARSGRALARGGDEQPWFAADSPFAKASFLLGSPGLNDVALQVLQACMPHRRVRPEGCESVQLSDPSAVGPVEIRAIAVPDQTVPAQTVPPQTVPPQTVPPQTVPPQTVPPQTVPPQTVPPQTVPAQAHVPSQAAPPPGEMTAASGRQAETTVLHIAESRSPSRRSRRGRRHHQVNEEYGATAPAAAAAAADAPTGNPVPASGSLATANGAVTAPAKPGLMASRERPGGPAAGRQARVSVPQLWNVEAVNADGQVLAAWRGIRLRDSGPLPRNAAWPPTLLSVFLERRAAELGLDDGLRVAVSCGHPEGPLPELVSSVPMPAPPADGEPLAEGRHAGPERSSTNTVTVSGTGPLAGFSLMLRAPVPVACGWVAVEPAQRQHEPAAGVVAAYAQLRWELTEAPAVLAARLTAVDAALEMAGLTGDRAGGRQLTVTRTTSDGWVTFAIDRAVIACAVVELSGVAAPVAIALLTKEHAHARSTAQAGAAQANAGHNGAAHDSAPHDSAAQDSAVSDAPAQSEVQLATR